MRVHLEVVRKVLSTVDACLNSDERITCEEKTHVRNHSVCFFTGLDLPVGERSRIDA